MAKQPREFILNINMACRSAKVFLLQGEQMLRTASTNGLIFFDYYISPCAANLAFSCELYLKILIAAENNNIVKEGHGLNDLWKQVGIEHQHKIEQEYSRQKTILTLDQCLSTHDLNFIEWRYYAEAGKNIRLEPWSLYYLSLSLYHVCEEVIENAN